MGKEKGTRGRGSFVKKVPLGLWTVDRTGVNEILARKLSRVVPKAVTKGAKAL